MEVIENDLSDKQKEVIIGVFFEGKNIVQLSQELGVHKSSISRRFWRAIAKIKKELRFLKLIPVEVD